MKDNLLLLLQLCNSSLPVGAYSYSESLETLVDKKLISDEITLKKWLINELNYGSIRIEMAIMIRSYNAFLEQDIQQLNYWNNWFSASRETSELRQQSWQMGKSLISLFKTLESSNQSLINIICNLDSNCNYAIAFGIITANGNIILKNAVLGYLHSWLNNLINVGIKLIPLGQTKGQKILSEMQKNLLNIYEEIINLDDENLLSCSYGLSIFSMQHETLYSRLFRS
jgi:urease accessory protein